MKRPATTATLLILAILAMGADSCDTTTSEKATTGSEQGQPAADTKAKPEVEHDLNCDYLLKFSDDLQGEDHHKFVGGGTLTNTGNVTARVQVTFKWSLLGEPALVVRKTYKVRKGHRRDVNVSVPATGEQIDAHQSGNSKCSAKAKIVGTS